MTIPHGKIAARSNRVIKRFESLITVAKLKSDYLFGIEIRDKDGNEMPASVYQQYIDNAVSLLEHDLDIWVTPTEVVEHKDYDANSYFAWGYLQTNELPVISIETLEISYLRDNSGDITALDIPQEWIRLEQDTGIIRLLPNNKFPAGLQVGSGGSFFPELFKRHGYVPNLWVLKYTVGFADGKVPVLLNEVIARIAAMQALSIAGNLILGAGIAGSSISLDGLSQSIQTTQSAENSGYSATLKEYRDRVFGATKDDQNALIKILRHYYKGVGINII